MHPPPPPPPHKRKLGDAMNFLVQRTMMQVKNEIRHHLQITHYSKSESGWAFLGTLQARVKREQKV